MFFSTLVSSVSSVIDLSVMSTGARATTTSYV